MSFPGRTDEGFAQLRNLPHVAGAAVWREGEEKCRGGTSLPGSLCPPLRPAAAARSGLLAKLFGFLSLPLPAWSSVTPLCPSALLSEVESPDLAVMPGRSICRLSSCHLRRTHPAPSRSFLAHDRTSLIPCSRPLLQGVFLANADRQPRFRPDRRPALW
jgi:hypothetical protein